MIHRILIVEDDASFGMMLQSWFKRNGFEVVLCTKVESAKKELLKDKFSLVLTDLRLPDGDGIMLLAWIREQKQELPVIMMTSYAEVQSAVAAIKLGAEDFLEKPINPTILKQKIEQTLGAIGEPQPAKQKEPKAAKSKPVSAVTDVMSPAALEMYNYIKMVAPTRMSVLILGESGTGKEYAARMIHENSTRRDAPFIAVDCGSLSRELAASELFGHLKGSFTSAIADKKGVFEQASGGTVFLDEVGNLSYDVQVQLLRALQEQKVRQVGAATDIKVDVRIIAATNENLENAIEQGRFREDLYHRLNEFTLNMPPLRERLEDLEMFASHFLQEANEELGKQVKRISKDAIKIFMHYPWTGNLRELRNVVRRAALFATTDEITPENLPIMNAPKVENLSLRPGNEKEQIEAALQKARGNKTLAAQLLKIDRKTLYNKMHQYGMKL